MRGAGVRGFRVGDSVAIAVSDIVDNVVDVHVRDAIIAVLNKLIKAWNYLEISSNLALKSSNFLCVSESDLAKRLDLAKR